MPERNLSEECAWLVLASHTIPDPDDVEGWRVFGAAVMKQAEENIKNRSMKRHGAMRKNFEDLYGGK
jgi:hypothetical protein